MYNCKKKFARVSRIPLATLSHVLPSARNSTRKTPRSAFRRSEVPSCEDVDPVLVHVRISALQCVSRQRAHALTQIVNGIPHLVSSAELHRHRAQVAAIGFEFGTQVAILLHGPRVDKQKLFFSFRHVLTEKKRNIVFCYNLKMRLQTKRVSGAG